jgi:hypothetical protein
MGGSHCYVCGLFYHLLEEQRFSLPVAAAIRVVKQAMGAAGSYCSERFRNDRLKIWPKKSSET